MGLVSLLTLGSRWTFVGGKGGVGKTTTAAALAVSLADAGERVLALSTDPAHSLGDALAIPLSAEPTSVPGLPTLSALEVDAERERERFLAAHEPSLLSLIERGTYLERADVEGFLDLALPGMDELAALLQLLRLADGPGRVVIDTAPTGHTFRLLSLPSLLGGWLSALEAMDAKHQAVATALAGAARDDETSRFLIDLRERLERFSALLSDPTHTRFVLVTTPEPMVLAETYRYLDSLTELGIALGGVVVNKGIGNRGQGAKRASARSSTGTAGGVPMVFVPRLAAEPRGVDGLRRFAASAGAESPLAPDQGERQLGGESPTAAPVIRLGQPYRPPLDRRLYLVGGKGGVGKTAAASALAVLLAEESNGPVLLLSTDPAGSLAETFGFPLGAGRTGVPGVKRLELQQVDAAKAWEAFRAEYREQTEQLFEGVLGGLSAGADREVVARLVDLAPPGVDELMALLEVVDLTEHLSYNALVLDTAPTGHLLRLLELPGVALDWAHTLLRLLLKYREVVGLGDLAERVLKLSRTLRALRDRLADPEHSWFLVVALPEALSVPETRRLFSRLRALGIAPDALLINRLFGAQGAGVEHARELLTIAGEVPGLGAPEWGNGPEGTEELLRFARSWRRVHQA